MVIFLSTILILYAINEEKNNIYFLVFMSIVIYECIKSILEIKGYWYSTKKIQIKWKIKIIIIMVLVYILALFQAINIKSLVIIYSILMLFVNFIDFKYMDEIFK